MNVEELPVELLSKIFNYLPSYRNVSLVNKCFYSVACKLSDPTITLTLDSSMFHTKDKKRKQFLEDVKNTTRSIRNFRVYFMCEPARRALTSTIPMTLKWRMNVFNKFSASIENITIGGLLEFYNFLDFLSFVPNAERLVLKGFRIWPPFDVQPKKKRLVMPNDKELNLHKLKTLKFQHCNDSFLDVFSNLPLGVLTELKLDNRDLCFKDLSVLLNRQTNIKKLSIKWLRPADVTDVFDNLNLEYLEWMISLFKQKTVEVILKKQVNLKTLKLNGDVVHEDLMNVIVNHLTQLETFSMNVSQTPIEAFKNITKLKKLKDLTLRSFYNGSLEPFNEFAKLNNSNIVALDIGDLKDMSVNFITALAKSVPNLNVLRFSSRYNMDVLNAILTSFNFVEILRLDVFPEYEFLHFNDSDSLTASFNPNLIELRICYSIPYRISYLETLIQCYPNLKKLHIKPLFALTVYKLQLILEGFTKLESLSLAGEGASPLWMEDLNCLEKHKNHLKFVAFENSQEPTPQKLKMLREIFNVVNCEFIDGLEMAVDKKTMKSETKDLFV